MKTLDIPNLFLDSLIKHKNSDNTSVYYKRIIFLTKMILNLTSNIVLENIR